MFQQLKYLIRLPCFFALGIGIASIVVSYTSVAQVLEENECGFVPVPNSGHYSSRPDCIKGCKKNSECLGVIYNAKKYAAMTNSCTYSLGPSASLKRDKDDDLAFMKPCYKPYDFSIVRNGSIETQVAYFSKPLLSYFAAMKFCACLGAHLFVADSMEKLWVMYGIIDLSQYVWVGLDRRNTTGQFFWANSANLTDSLKSQIFRPGEPDNFYHQHCVAKDPRFFLLADEPCKAQKAFVCEKKIC